MSQIGYIAKPMSKKYLRNEAKKLRDIFEVGVDKPFPILRFLELTLPTLDSDYVFEVVDVKEMPDKYGETFPDKAIIRIRQDVYNGADQGNPRDLFTLAHELAHYLLHQKSELSLARTSYLEEVPAYCSPEWQANTLAAELLCPSEVAAKLTINEIKKVYKVSTQVAQIQSKK